MDLENENDEVNMPSSPEPTISHSDDLDFFKDFENEFLVITYNVDLTSKLTKPSISFQHIEKFDLNNETSLSKYDEEERTVLYFNDSFPLNIVFPNNLKSKKDIDDGEIDNYLDNWMPLNLVKNLYVPFGISFDPKRYYKDDVHTRILRRPRDEGQELFTSHAWRRLFEIRAPLVREFILEFRSTCRMSDTEMGLDVADTLCFQLGGVRRRMTWRQFILVLVYILMRRWQRMVLGHIAWVVRDISSKGQAPEKVTSVNHFYLRIKDRGTANVPYLLAQYLFRHAEGRKSGARLSGGYFIGRLATYFGLVAPGPERQPNVAAGTLRAVEDAPVVNEGAQADLAPV
ncbi:hypothetical protein Tco_0980578 [Tanacetum coccineum]